MFEVVHQSLEGTGLQNVSFSVGLFYIRVNLCIPDSRLAHFEHKDHRTFRLIHPENV